MYVSPKFRNEVVGVAAYFPFIVASVASAAGYLLCRSSDDMSLYNKQTVRTSPENILRKLPGIIWISLVQSITLVTSYDKLDRWFYTIPTSVLRTYEPLLADFDRIQKYQASYLCVCPENLVIYLSSWIASWSFAVFHFVHHRSVVSTPLLQSATLRIDLLFSAIRLEYTWWCSRWY